MGRLTVAVRGAALFLALSAATPTRAAERLAAGTFLYASPELRGSVFEASVVVLVVVEDAGVVGLIVNKPTGVAPRTLLSLEGVERLKRPFYLGGPVTPHGVTALLRSGSPPEAAKRVLDDVYFTGDVDSLTPRFREDGADRRLRLYAGYSGWSPGQLENEIALGSWVVVNRGRAGLIFSEEPESLWEEVYVLMKRIEARLPGPRSGR